MRSALPRWPVAIDLTALEAATSAVGTALKDKAEHHVVVVKSTVVPGTTDRVVVRLLEKTSGRVAGRDLGVGVNPEFLTEGQAVADFMAPDRLVLGAVDGRTHDALERLHEAFPVAVPRLKVNLRTAELIKYTSNALLATMISFSNEIANLSAAVGEVDVVDVMRGICLSQYLAPPGPEGDRVPAPIASFLEAGAGFGGSCLPKDVRALIAEGNRLGQPMRVLRAVIETNEGQPDELIRIVEGAAGDLRGTRVTVLGLAFKPDTDDVRESPSIAVVGRLVRRGAIVTVHDPVVTRMPEDLSAADISLTSDLDAALLHAQVVVLVTRWEHYRDVPALVTAMEPRPVLVDGRRMLDKSEFSSYAGIGLS